MPRGAARGLTVAFGLNVGQDSRKPPSRPGTQPPQRISLAVEDFRRAKGTNPYEHVGVAGKPEEPRKPQVKRDLKRLGDWIKMKRELDERAIRGDSDEPEGEPR